MLKGTWGTVDNKLDVGFHCVRPTEIGNAISSCVSSSPLEQLGEASFASQDQVCLSHSLLKTWSDWDCIGSGGHLSALWVKPIGAAMFSAKSSRYPAFLKRGLLSGLKLPCKELWWWMVTDVSFLGMPKGGRASCEEGLAPSVHFPLTQTLSIWASLLAILNPFSPSFPW